jgi:hypothetical protein
MSFGSRIRKLEGIIGANGCNCRSSRGSRYVAVPSNTTEGEKATIIAAYAPAPCPIHGPSTVIVTIPVEQRDSDRLYQAQMGATNFAEQ